MTKRNNDNIISVPGIWNKNVPVFMEDFHHQKKYDCFMALKHNLNNTKTLAVLFHRLCGSFDKSTPVTFTEKFKLIKVWLFLTDRTDKLPNKAYVALWKAWKLYTDTGFSRVVNADTLYNQHWDDFYPSSEYMYVSNKPMTEPLYFMYKPQRYRNDDDSDDVEFHDEYDRFGNPIIPDTVIYEDSYIQTSKVFEYLNRHFFNIPCDYCGNHLNMDNLCLSLTCKHMVHTTCCENYSCLQCESENLYPRITAMDIEGIEG